MDPQDPYGDPEDGPLDGPEDDQPPRAHLRIFRPPDECETVGLQQRPYVLGRFHDVDIQFQHLQVSRHHATIRPAGEEFVVEDNQSTTGTFVNGQRVDRHLLQHGDTIQIADFVIQFRTDTDAKSAPTWRHGEVMSKFNLLPSTMSMRYRTIEYPAEEIFATGDTLNVGEGGILIMADEPMPDQQVLEVELTWPQGRTIKLFGEVLGVDEKIGFLQLCVKLHNIDRNEYMRVLERSRRGQWIHPPSESPLY